MSWKNKFQKINLLLLFKASLGSAIAIFLANRFNLLHSSSAGITTLLTLQNTKKETIMISFKRIIAFIIAIIIGRIILTNFGYTTIAFGVFIFIFVAICNLLSLQDGIVMNAVLITHSLIEKRIDMNFILNELSLLLIGMGIGVILNLIMPNNMKKIKKEQELLENQLADILRTIASILNGQNERLIRNGKQKINFTNLDKVLDDLLLKAYQDANNRLLTETRYQISFLEMRKIQVIVLKDIFKNIEEVHSVFPQSITLAKYIEKMAEEFNELNNVKKLIMELEELQINFESQELPTSRNEFENRAILFNVSKSLKNFLQIKRTFVESSTLNK